MQVMSDCLEAVRMLEDNNSAGVAALIEEVLSVKSILFYFFEGVKSLFEQCILVHIRREANVFGRLFRESRLLFTMSFVFITMCLILLLISLRRRILV